MDPPQNLTFLLLFGAAGGRQLLQAPAQLRLLILRLRLRPPPLFPPVSLAPGGLIGGGGRTLLKPPLITSFITPLFSPKPQPQFPL